MKKRDRHHNPDFFVGDEDDDSTASSNNRTELPKNHQKLMPSSGFRLKISKEPLIQQRKIREELEGANPNGNAIALGGDFNGFPNTQSQFGDWNFRGAGKSIPESARPMVYPRQRHTPTCGVDFSIKSQKHRQPQPEHVPMPDPAQQTKLDIGSAGVCSSNVPNGGAGYDMDNYVTDRNQGSEREHNSFIVRVRKGKNGKFVSSRSPEQSSFFLRVNKGKDGKFVSSSLDESWLVTGDVPGGPVDGSVIPSFLGHVASRMWTGQMRGVLKSVNVRSTCDSLIQWYRSTMSVEAKRQIDSSGVGHLPRTMFKHIDFPLISAFVERWQPDTNTFHMPFGEMTIMLHDVWHILRIPVDGGLIHADSDTSQLKDDVMEVLGVPQELLWRLNWSGNGAQVNSMLNLCREVVQDVDRQAQVWAMLMLGATLFVGNSGDRVRPSCVLELKDGLDAVHRYSWGSAALAHLYRQLGVASRGDSQSITGCLTLLQSWIYEYFPLFRPHEEPLDIYPTSPRAYMWSTREEDNSESRLQSLRICIDQLQASEVMWLPYGPDPASSVPRTIFIGWLRYRDVIEPYMPARALRQLGYVQTVPFPITRPESHYRPWHSKLYKVECPNQTSIDAWLMFPGGYMLSLTQYQPSGEDNSACSDDYTIWYNRCSHPRLLNNIVEPTLMPRADTDYWVGRYAKFCRKVISQARARSRLALAAELDQLTREYNASQ